MEKLSRVGNNIVGSEIIKISQQIKEISKTKPVANLTIGDFNSAIWPIPAKLKQYIEQCYEDDFTNYPNSQGELNLRESVSKHIKHQFGVDYSPEEIERTKANEIKDKEFEANVLKLEAERIKAKNLILERLGITEEEAKLLLS